MNFRDLVREVGRILSIQANAKGLELIVDIDPAVPERIKADPGRFRQILLNLGTNAVKFTHSGEVRVRVGLSKIADGRTALFGEVSDTGIGIESEKMATLFRPFAQVDLSTTRRFGGTGLGLSIVARLVELMGGKVGVESRVNHGSRFWFTVRIDAATSTADDAPKLKFTSLAGRRILIVDDNATDRKLIKAQVEPWGASSALAAGAAEAIRHLQHACARGTPFEIALLDNDMPGGDGAGLGALITADDHFSQTRVVLLTSPGTGDDLEHTGSGFSAFLTKPVVSADLLDCLVWVLDGGAADWRGGSRATLTEPTSAGR